MYQLHFKRPASNPVHLFLLIFINIFLIFVFLYLPTNVSIYFIGNNLYYTRDKDGVRSISRTNMKTIAL